MVTYLCFEITSTIFNRKRYGDYMNQILDHTDVTHKNNMESQVRSIAHFNFLLLLKSVITKVLECKTKLNLYALLCDESLFAWLSHDIIAYHNNGSQLPYSRLFSKGFYFRIFWREPLLRKLIPGHMFLQKYITTINNIDSIIVVLWTHSDGSLLIFQAGV